MSMSGTVGALTPRQAELKPLFAPLKVGAIEAPNRVFMAPLTRNRAKGDGTPKDWAIEYYRQRAGAGLIITEATQVSAMGKGYLDTPGLHEDRHQEAWKRIVDGVHAAGGRIFLQLWHVGRISHSDLLPDGAQPHAPSAIRAAAQTFTSDGFVDVSDPKAMTLDEIESTIEAYAAATRRAMAAGFDGVEVHAANGYLIDQFLQDRTNHRDDAYGGSIENRVRFLKEVTEAVVAEAGKDRTGIRLSPLGTFNDIADSDSEALFAAAVDTVDSMGLAYLHFVERFGGEVSEADMALLSRLSKRFEGVFIPNGRFKADEAARWIADGLADAVAFGKPFIANPDLPTRFALGADLNRWDESTFYGGDERGYTDYPSLEESLLRDG